MWVKKIFACAIDANADAVKNKVDIRVNDLLKVPHQPFQLPVAIENKCLALMQKLGLQYGAIDMIVTPEDEFVFLEINAGGQWLWIEQATGLPISKAIAELLISQEGL